MAAAAQPGGTRGAGGRRRGTRAVAGFLVAVMAMGCVALWVGVPAICLYAAAQVTDSLASHFLVALPLTILSVIVLARGLFWVNRLYLVVSLAGGRNEEDWDDELDPPRWARGPLEPMLVGSLVIALVALVVWFLLFAENPSLYGFVP